MRYIMVLLLTAQQAALEAEIKTLFGLTVDDCFPGSDEQNIILGFAVESSRVEQIRTHLQQKKATGAILDVMISTQPSSIKDEATPQRTREEDIVCAKSALATLSQAWVQTVFGDQVTDVVMIALKELIEKRQQRSEKQPSHAVFSLERMHYFKRTSRLLSIVSASRGLVTRCSRWLRR